MKKRPTSTRNPIRTTRADLWLQQCLGIMAPMARMLIANGVTYPVFAQALKRVFLQAAEQELKTRDRRMTKSALSLLSGVHRKDVRAMAAEPDQLPSKSSSLADDVVVRWLTDKNFLDSIGRPRELNIKPAGTTAEAPSFEHLTQSVSKDFHARSILNELTRLGIVVVADGKVCLKLTSNVDVPRDVEEALRSGTAQVRDQLTAVHTNLAALDADRPPEGGALDVSSSTSSARRQSTTIEFAVSPSWTKIFNLY